MSTTKKMSLMIIARVVSQTLSSLLKTPENANIIEAEATL